MFVLVDYDNLKPEPSASGIRALVGHLTERICSELRQAPRRLDFRLYGGWYDEQLPSRRAQDLAPVLQAEYPARMSPLALPMEEGGRPPSISLSVELARSMLIDPSRHLLYTVRPQKMRGVLKVRSPKGQGRTVLPDLMKFGFLRQVPYLGSGNHRRFRLNHSFDAIEKARHACRGDYERFLSFFPQGLSESPGTVAFIILSSSC